MESTAAFEAEPQPAALPLAIRRPRGLAVARAGQSLALRAARGAGQALARREPAPLLAVGFGAGLLARAALGAIAAARSPRTPPGQLAPSPPDSDLVGLHVETLTVQTIRFLRRQ